MAYRNIAVWLEDVMQRIERIKFYISDLNSFEEYKADVKTTDAVERNIEIIAEALKHAVKLEPELPITNIRKIINFRNIINHQYYNVEPERVWIILKNDFPLLEQQVKALLDDFEKKLELNEL